MSHAKYIVRELLEVFRKHMGEVENLGKLQRLKSQLEMAEACESLLQYIEEHEQDINAELNTEEFDAFKDGPVFKIRKFSSMKAAIQSKINELS
ncbi:hypothetical protein AB6D12_00380 [Vibrio cyclitrophicus]